MKELSDHKSLTFAVLFSHFVTTTNLTTNFVFLALTQALIADGSSNEIREPLGLHAQSIGARSIRLKWDLPIGVNPATKLSYSVFYRVEGSSR